MSFLAKVMTYFSNWAKTGLEFKRPNGSSNAKAKIRNQLSGRSNAQNGVRTPRQKPQNQPTGSSNAGFRTPRPKIPKKVSCSRAVRTPYRAFERPATGPPFFTPKTPKTQPIKPQLSPLSKGLKVSSKGR